MTVSLDRGYDSRVTREGLAHHLTAAIAAKGQPAPLPASLRWVVEPTHAWTNADKTLVWCTERRAVVIAFWITFSAALATD